MHKGFSLKAAASGLLITVAVFVANSTLAVEPANIQAGPVYIAPTLDVKTGYVDNLFRSRRDEKSTWTSQITPRVQLGIMGFVVVTSVIVIIDQSKSGRLPVTLITMIIGHLYSLNMV